MSFEERLRLRPGVAAGSTPQGRHHLLRWPYSSELDEVTAVQRSALTLLAEAPVTEDALCHRVNPEPGEDTRQEVARLVRDLRGLGWLRVTVVESDNPLYTMEPVRTAPHPASVPDQPTLSRFATLAREGTDMALRSPRARCELVLHDPRLLTLVGLLGGAPDPREWARRTGLSARAVERTLGDMAASGLLVGAETEDGDQAALAVRQWNPHELLFHTRSRFNARCRPGHDFGTTYSFRDTQPPPRERAPLSEDVTMLEPPDLERLRVEDPPLTRVLEDRASHRRHDETQPLTLAQLGEFLYRSAGARPGTGGNGSARPYPTAGSSYELELYPVIRRVAGIEPGLYHYSAHRHELSAVPGAAPLSGRLVQMVRAQTDAPAPPQVLVVVTARFGRVMWKYQSLSYSLILKDVGVLYQVMYCVATAMGLAPCAVGTGLTEEFCEAIGTDPTDEAPVGEFVLGSRPPHTGDHR
ncbi:SagB family peptide dehydrogenase [Halostreptopolyspora alba]|uniref:SagB/ThcOx family dehydrogenase n=1 Tax=Halostreptopolyspora alba TaxID=2487137 RepID=A0A3N0EDS7_9ACTN|nr:SagB/ThcOx family dehydrogenase [Nocardiopsaceae bacterium YIM 96095]